MVDPDSFAAGLPFVLDAFQVEAIEAIERGDSVLVAAPTGSGKTVVAEYAIARALDLGGKTFYTTPLKALSNQKYGDLYATLGPTATGLLTGDNAIASDAPVVVMTTEILRNMLYERAPALQGLRTVVMDEVHYLQDPYRGGVWEEVLIHLPASVNVVCLSATISNAEEFGEWIGTLRGATKVVVEERRPVPLEHHYLIGHRLYPMHVEQDGVLLPNPYVASLDQRELKTKRYQRRGSDTQQMQRISRPREGHRRFYVPKREEVVDVLGEEEMLPAIYFVFSRAGCDRGVRWLLNSGARLTSRSETERIRDIAERRAAWIEEEDLVTLGFSEFLEGLMAGVAAHHAGMLPVFKETVEELFEAGLVKVVFATETLSLGINMPARTVVIEDLWKFQGERHEILTPGEYTQLTGRAGRRGIDQMGHAVVLYQRQVPFERVAGLAATRTYNLTSSFRPSYNMAANLVRTATKDEAHRLLNSSFAQFLADRGVVALERSRVQDTETLSGYLANTVCELGEFSDYWKLLTDARRMREQERLARERDRVADTRDALAALRPGEVIRVPDGGRRGGLAVVVSSREGKTTVVSQDRRTFRMNARDFPDPPAVLTRIALPRSGNSRSSRYRRDVAAKLVTLRVKEPRRARRKPDPKVQRRAAELEALAREHPCHACPDLAKHERWAVRADEVGERLRRTDTSIRVKTETLARQFDRVLATLGELGYVNGWALSKKGVILARIYGEADILIAEAIHADVFDGLDPAEIAAVVASMVYEARERTPLAGGMPTVAADEAYERLRRIWRRIRRAEDRNNVQLCRELEPGFSVPIHAWATGTSIDDVLVQTGMAPGDFIRNCKQLIDLLRQVEEVAGSDAAGSLAAARHAVRRGVVAYTGLSVV